MRDEGQWESHTFVPYEKSRARRMARKLGLRIICAGKTRSAAAPAQETRTENKRGSQHYGTQSSETAPEKMREELAG